MSELHVNVVRAQFHELAHKSLSTVYESMRAAKNDVKENWW